MRAHALQYCSCCWRKRNERIWFAERIAHHTASAYMRGIQEVHAEIGRIGDYVFAIAFTVITAYIIGEDIKSAIRFRTLECREL